MEDDVKAMIREASDLYKRELDIIEANRDRQIAIQEKIIGELAVGECGFVIAHRLRQRFAEFLLPFRSAAIRLLEQAAPNRRPYQKWSRLFEQHSPIYKWVPSGLS